MSDCGRRGDHRTYMPALWSVSPAGGEPETFFEAFAQRPCARLARDSHDSVWTELRDSRAKPGAGARHRPGTSAMSTLDRSPRLASHFPKHISLS